MLVVHVRMIAVDGETGCMLNDVVECRMMGGLGWIRGCDDCDARLVSCVARFCGRPGRRTLTVPDAAAAVCQ